MLDNADTVGHCITNNPEQFDEIMEKFVAVYKNMHSTDIEEMGGFTSLKDTWNKWADGMTQENMLRFWDRLLALYFWIEDAQKLAEVKALCDYFGLLRGALFRMKHVQTCGGIICIAYLFTVVGVPAEAISVILCVESIAAMFNGVCNESANIATTFILGRENNMLDENKYLA